MDDDAGQGTLTILFTDVEGSTAFRSRAGDAVGNQVMSAHDRLVIEQVARHDGRHVKSLGDGCMAVFTSPRRAVECAVAVQRAATSSPLQVRIGLNAGEVTMTGGDVFGSAVNAAARIAAKAQGGEIFVSDVVRQLMGSTSGLDLRDKGRVRLRGFPDRWRLYEVVWRDERAAAGNPEPAPLVGRAAELARLHRVLDNLDTGRGAVVVFRGEAGIGKTRLAMEGLDYAQSRGWRVLVGRASPFEGGLGLEPIVEAFGGLLRGLDKPALHALVADLPQLARLFEGLGLPPAPSVGDPALERTLLFESVARLLERLARETPVVLLIDDVQWADAASLELLHQLGRGIDRHPAALLFTYRSGERDESDRLRRLLVSLRRLRVVEEIDLGRLDATAVEALARGFLGGHVPPGLLEILVRAAGTPLFIDALLRGLLDRGQLTRAGDAWSLSDGTTEVPTAVRDVILERLDNLEPDARRVVDLVALTGGTLAHDVLAETGELDADVLAETVASLITSGVAEEVDADDLAYRLAHPLYYEVAAAALPQIARRRGHALLATAMEKARPTDLEGLGRHYLAAGPAADRARALEVLVDAGGRASRRRADAEAARFFDAAVALARKESSTAPLAPLLEQLAQAEHRTGRTDEALAAWTEALDLRTAAADDVAVARVRRALGIAEFEHGRLVEAREHLDLAAALLSGRAPTPELAELLFERVIVGNRLVLVHELHVLAAELDEVAAALGTGRSRAQACYARAAALSHIGRFAEGLEAGLRGLEHCEPGDEAVEYRLRTACCDSSGRLGDHAGLLEHSQAGRRLVSTLGVGILVGGAGLYRLLAAVQAGRFDDGLAYSDEDLEICRRFGNERRTATVLGFRTWLLAWRGDLVEAEDLVATLRARVAPSSYADKRGFGLVPVAEACVALEQGQADRALALMTGLYDGTDFTGWLVLPLAEMWARSGDPELARRARGALPTFESPLVAANAAYVEGLVHVALSTPGAAESFQDSVRRFDDLAMPFYASRSRLELARVLVRVDPVTAAAEAERAAAVFRTLPATRYAERAEALLATLSVRVQPMRPRVERTGPLSRRQVEVARLVAEGLTNAEIAERLTVSVRTVTSHLDHIYTRLGIGSRAALARQVATQPEEFAAHL